MNLFSRSDLILMLIVLIPLLAGYVIGLVFVALVRMTIAVVEGYQAGQRLINGE